jgi:hypothetical protein
LGRGLSQLLFGHHDRAELPNSILEGGEVAPRNDDDVMWR